jgi:hypothetical protein
LLRAGVSSSSISAQLGWFTRREREREEERQKERRRRARRERAKAKRAEEERLKKAKKKPKKKPKKKLSPAKQAAITRAEQRLEQLPTKPRTLDERELLQTRYQELVETLRRAGYSEPEIRSYIHRLSRRRRRRDRTLAELQADALGQTTPLQGSIRTNWYVLRSHITFDTPEFRRYIDEAAELGVGYEEAVDRWFSPNAE